MTDIPPSSYFEQAIPIAIIVGTRAALCSSSPCTFTWTRGITPILTSVNPSSISSSQTLTLTGQNLTPSRPIPISSVHVMIGGETCTVTAITNSTITCHIVSLPLGNHSIVASIDGMLSTTSNCLHDI